ncbi:MAG: type VI secretion system tip protein VgrG [Polyangiaceae bacterium]|nr:type VI secretion system tip protein VgrG [Polyangiaceae bacterium]
MERSDRFFFAFEGAESPEGPWGQLIVLEARGREEISAPYEYVIDLALADGASEVDHEALLGAKATLRIMTDAEPAVRLVHGLVVEVEELSVEKGSRLRVKLAPPYARARLYRKCVIHVDQTIKDVLVETLERGSTGMQLTASGGERAEPADGDWGSYSGFKATYALRVTDVARLEDVEARPYSVQYEESDVDFVSRILEEEGIAYHFEHTAEECVLVLADADAGRRDVAGSVALSQDKLHQESRNVRAGGRLRPKAVALLDYDHRKPDLALVGGSPSAGSEPMTIESPGRFAFSNALGEHLARSREEQLDSERRFVSLDTNARGLSAGSLFALEHPKFGGTYLAHRLEVQLRQRMSFAAADGEPTYTARVEGLFSCEAQASPASKFRPARRTARPRIVGSQTAVVTAEVGQDQEINVGGEGDFGSVRVRFHWDRDSARHEQEPTSCWVRVSQMFAGGRGHGAMFHPRVGDEVIVDHLDGDPDRPIITGRVYNGKNLSPENATQRPTYSCIKSMTSPYDGNFNMMAFDDLQGEEKYIVHVARDFIMNVRHNSARFVANFDKVHVKGDQETLIEGQQDFVIQGNQNFEVQSNQVVHIGATQTTSIDANQNFSVASSRFTNIGSMDALAVGALIMRSAGGAIRDSAPTITVEGDEITISGSASVTVKSAAHVTVEAPTIDVSGGTVNIHGSGTVNVVGKGTVNITGGLINLNC